MCLVGGVFIPHYMFFSLAVNSIIMIARVIVLHSHFLWMLTACHYEEETGPVGTLKLGFEMNILFDWKPSPKHKWFTIVTLLRVTTAAVWFETTGLQTSLSIWSGVELNPYMLLDVWNTCDPDRWFGWPWKLQLFSRCWKQSYTSDLPGLVFNHFLQNGRTPKPSGGNCIFVLTAGMQ